ELKATRRSLKHVGSQEPREGIATLGGIYIDDGKPVDGARDKRDVRMRAVLAEPSFDHVERRRRVLIVAPSNGRLLAARRDLDRSETGLAVERGSSARRRRRRELLAGLRAHARPPARALLSK